MVGIVLICFSVEMPDDRPGTYVRELETCIREGPQLIMCVVSNDQADRYSAIKKKLTVDNGIPSQVIKSRTIQKPGLSVATKVAIQMVCKLGGAPWNVIQPMKGVMVVGFDVCHDTKDKSKSYAAMVATMDLKSTSEYFSAVTPHKHGEEISNELANNIILAVRRFKEINQQVPERIIVYRDGVGEGQVRVVYEHEVQEIRNKLAGIYAAEGQTLKFCFVIVTKRINTRLFVQQQQRNPPPGTVVDDVITLPERHDFFLISQHVTQGTVSPTSYNVFDYGFGLAPGRLQQYTYKMCHLYVSPIHFIFTIFDVKYKRY